jgi:hypothetical protein
MATCQPLRCNFWCCCWLEGLFQHCTAALNVQRQLRITGGTRGGWAAQQLLVLTVW